MQIVALHQQGLTHQQIAAGLGCGKTVVADRLREVGIRRVGYEPAKDAEIAGAGRRAIRSRASAPRWGRAAAGAERGAEAGRRPRDAE